MAHIGRRIEFTKRRKAKLLKLMAVDGNVGTSCAAVGIARVTLYRHLDSDTEFAAAYAEARETAADVLEAEAYRRAVEGVPEPVYQGGREVGAVQRYSDVLLMLLLRSNRPSKFRENYVPREAPSDNAILALVDVLARSRQAISEPVPEEETTDGG